MARVWARSDAGLRGSDDVEMTRQEWQRLDLADDAGEFRGGREICHQIDRAIDAEHLMTGIAQHRRESAAACPEVENPLGSSPIIQAAAASG